MKTEEQIREQYKHELEDLKDLTDIVLPAHKNPEFVHARIELQESRIELLDWVLDQGDFAKE